MTPSDDRAVTTATPWAEVARDLGERPPSSLTAAELDLLADALFWLDRFDESVAARQAAYHRWAERDDPDGTAMAAWRLFYDHWLVGESIVARGWLDAARDRVGPRGSVAHGWLTVAEADVAMAEQRHATAVELADHAVTTADRHDDADLRAMALQALGRAQLLAERPDDGLRQLDRAMILVIGNRLSPLYTGWVYCNVIATCYGIADLRRASEWCRAALRWCDSLRHGELYPGLCRVYAAELAVLRGDWDEAASAAERARVGLETHDERYAGAAHYVAGEVARLRGDLAEAAAAYRRAHRLGHSAQPGLALLRLAQGDAHGAVAALRSAYASDGAPIERLQVLSAAVDAAFAAGDQATIAWASDEVTAVATTAESALVATVARSVDGRAAAARGDDREACDAMREAVDGFRQLDLPYDEARERERLATMCSRMADEVGAAAERETARALFARLGATRDVVRVDDAPVGGGLGATGSAITPSAATDVLSGRELEVVRLVAAGLTNRQVASRLVISHHTVARHLANVYAKLGVGSRAAATAWAYDHDLIGGGDDGWSRPVDGQD